MPPLSLTQTASTVVVGRIFLTEAFVMMSKDEDVGRVQILSIPLPLDCRPYQLLVPNRMRH
jgi:hypothetical protein